MPKKVKKRKKVKYPSLTPRLNSRVRQEYMDYDYVDQLSDDEKQFLEDFNKEYYQASVGRQKDEGKDNRFTKGKEAVKQAQHDNNKRNSDLYGQIRNKVSRTKLLNYDDVLNMVEDELSREVNPEYLEDAMIDYLDNPNDFENTSDDTSEDS